MVIIITGKYVRELRQNMGISQSELARRVGVTQAHIARIEANKVDARLSIINKILSVLAENKKKIRCKDMMVKHVVSISPQEKNKKVIQLMKKYQISQIPVIENNAVVGTIKESTLIHNLDKDLPQRTAKEIMEDPFPIVSGEDDVEVARALLDFHQAILVAEKGRINGIITKSDLLNLT